MRKWRRPALEEFEGLEFEEEPEEEVEEVRRYEPRPLRVTRFSDFDDEDDVEDSLSRFDKIKGLIRAGKYKPKQSDPWMAHILYSNLKELGEI